MATEAIELEMAMDHKPGSKPVISADLAEMCSKVDGQLFQVHVVKPADDGSFGAKFRFGFEARSTEVSGFGDWHSCNANRYVAGRAVYFRDAGTAAEAQASAKKIVKDYLEKLRNSDEDGGSSSSSSSSDTPAKSPPPTLGGGTFRLPEPIEMLQPGILPIPTGPDQKEDKDVAELRKIYQKNVTVSRSKNVLVITTYAPTGEVEKPILKNIGQFLSPSGGFMGPMGPGPGGPGPGGPGPAPGPGGPGPGPMPR